MDERFKECLWANFAAVIDMLKNAVVLCPDEVWQENKKIYYLTYHTTIFLDYYVTHPVKTFNPALPYTIMSEGELPAEAVDDVIPNRIYSRQEILSYLDPIREKCKTLILFSTNDDLMNRWINDSEISMHGLCPSIAERYTVLEIILYNLRHVQHHVAQLNLILRQNINAAPVWISHSS